MGKGILGRGLLLRSSLIAAQHSGASLGRHGLWVEIHIPYSSPMQSIQLLTPAGVAQRMERRPADRRVPGLTLVKGTGPGCELDPQ